MINFIYSLFVALNRESVLTTSVLRNISQEVHPNVVLSVGCILHLNMDVLVIRKINCKLVTVGHSPDDK